MPFISFDHRTTKIIYIILAAVGAVSLAGVILLNLPFFYELSTAQSSITFSLVALVMFILITFSLKEFILPNLDVFREKKNIGVIIFLILFLSIIISFSSNYIWTTPEIYAVEICFDADDVSSPLGVQSLSHPKTNRLYPPETFGVNRYPITIDSGQCVNGQIITLLGRRLRYSGDAHLAVTIREDPPEGRFYISIDNSPSVVLFEDDADQPPTQTILVREGFKTISPWSSTVQRYWFYGIRIVMVLFSAMLVSLVLFGLTERTIKFSVENDK
jgi:hypothetical protein